MKKFIFYLTSYLVHLVGRDLVLCATGCRGLGRHFLDAGSDLGMVVFHLLGAPGAIGLPINLLPDIANRNRTVFLLRLHLITRNKRKRIILQLINY